MRTRETRYGTMGEGCQNAPLRIKSPQLYRLSYRPKRRETCRNLVPSGSRLARIVSVVYSDPIARATYHGSAEVGAS